MPATILSLPTEIRLMIFSYVFKTYTIYGLLPYSTVTHAGVSSLPKGHLRASIPLTCRLFHAESVFLVRFHAVLQCDHNTLLSKGRGLARVALPVHVLAGLRYLSVRMAYDDILVNGSTSFTSSLSRAIPEQCRPTIRTTSLCLSKDATPSQLSRMERHFQCERRAKNVLQVLMCLIDMLPSLQNVLAVYGSNVAEGGRGAEACERYLQSTWTPESNLPKIPVPSYASAQNAESELSYLWNRLALPLY